MSLGVGAVGGGTLTACEPTTHKPAFSRPGRAVDVGESGSRINAIRGPIIRSSSDSYTPPREDFMGFAGGSITFKRFFVQGEAPALVNEALIEQLSARAMGRDSIQTADHTDMGWITASTSWTPT